MRKITKKENQNVTRMKKESSYIRRFLSAITTTITILTTRSKQQSPLIEKVDTTNTQRYTFSAISYGETVIHSFRNILYHSNVLNSPYTESSKLYSTSNSYYSLHLSNMGPYILAADILGIAYILDLKDNLNVLKMMNLPARGRAFFFRSHVYGFEGTNYFYLSKRDIQQTGALFHDWTLTDGEVKSLSMMNEIIRFSSFESVNLLISIEEFGGKKMIKTDPTAGVNALTSFVSTRDTATLTHLKGIGGLSTSHHIGTLYDTTPSKAFIYNSANDQFPYEVSSTDFNTTLDILVLEGTNYVAFACVEPRKLKIIKIPSMDVWDFNYSNGETDPSLQNYMRQIAWIKDSNYLWLGMDRQFDVYRVLPPVCHKSCATCTTGIVINGCDTCNGGYDQVGGYCIPTAENCQSGATPYYFPETSNCQATCGNGFFIEPTNICRSCIQDCKICSDKLTCDTCNSGYNLDSNKLCESKCSAGQYYTGSTCADCYFSCKSCSGSTETECILCHDLTPKNLDGTCNVSCDDGKYFHRLLKGCINCPSQCKNCESSETNQVECLSCIPDLYHQVKYPPSNKYFGCVTSCSDGFYKKISDDGNLKTCEACPENCKSCNLIEGTGTIGCDNCNEEYFYYNRTCISSCPIGTFENNGYDYLLCTKCAQDCIKCSSVTKCEQCATGYELVDDKTSCKSLTSSNNGNGNTESDYTSPQNTNDDGSGFIIMFLLILFVSVIFLVVVSKKKAIEEERRRRLRSQRGEERNVPVAEPFHPIILEGQTNPLTPVGINEDDIDPNKVNMCYPLQTEENPFTRQESFLEIEVKRKVTIPHIAKPVKGGMIDLDNMADSGKLHKLRVNSKIGGNKNLITVKKSQEFKKKTEGMEDNYFSDIEFEDEDEERDDRFAPQNAFTPSPYVPPHLMINSNPNRKERKRSKLELSKNSKMKVKSRANFNTKNID